MNSKNTPDRVILTVAADQASHGETLVLQSQDGSVYFRTSGNFAIDKITASEAAKRWNTHADLLAALESLLGLPDVMVAAQRAGARDGMLAAIAKARGEV